MEVKMIDQRSAVRFAGEREGHAPLTWGQYGMWLAMHRNPQSYYTIAERLEVPTGAAATVQAVSDAIGTLVSRYEALRTLVYLHDGEPRQHLIRSGTVPLLLIKTTPDQVDATMDREWSRTCREPFKREAEPPFRASLIIADGKVERVVLAFDHLAVDAAGAAIAADDLRALLDGGEPPPCGLQPLDLAREEQTANRSITDNAIKYWLEQQRRLPPRMFSSVAPPDEPHTQIAEMFSPALLTAGRMLAARHETTLSTTILAATAALIGAWTGHATVALNVVVGNRFRQDLARMVTNLQKLGLFVMDLTSSSTLDELVVQAKRSALRTYRYAYYDHAAMDRATSQLAAERGTDVNPFACFNDFSRFSGDPVPDGVDGTELRSMLSATTLTWQPHPSQVRCHFCLRLRGTDMPDHRFLLSANTDYLPRPDIERFLRSLERYLVTSQREEVRFDDLRKGIIDG